MTLALKNHRRTIFRWYREFQGGNFTLDDAAEREGRPRTKQGWCTSNIIMIEDLRIAVQLAVDRSICVA
ncbi:unnamed protein product [Acanthoscelides obtectus]|uniref:Uncharacterized protein n=1 Tax=Acanthoscelides obtectus TaxID=200917 RepID=A0A9P0LNA0_ACAOB|nr:unnamed protein product [Acanthoscelides obtectus]CAK1641475.1 hypothetical protein AOBTE_LOCUS12430 [Acanthoscelides obtectus]